MVKLPKRKLLVLILIVILIISGGILAYHANDGAIPFTNKYPGTKYGKGYEQNAFLYSCSKEIELYNTGETNPEFEGGGPEYLPVNQEEAKRFCRSGGVIEYRAVLDILKRQDVSTVIKKYDTTQAWVRALGHRHIHDKGYLNRILPTYSDIKIDCIIVVHTPESTRFFIENGEKHESHDHHQYVEVPASEFLASLNKASDSDITAFWLGLH